MKKYHSEPIFKTSDWRETSEYIVCSVFLYYKEYLHSVQVGIPIMEVSETRKYDLIERAKEQLYNEAEKGKKGFEPIKRGGPATIPTITFAEEDRRKQNIIQNP